MSTTNGSLTPTDRFLIAQEAFTRYAAALDQHDLTALELLHDEDAVWIYTVAGQPALGPIRGREAILEFVSSAPVNSDERQRHVVTNVHAVENDGGLLEATGYLLRTSNTAGEAVIAATGTVRIRLTRVTDSWKISSLAIDFDNAPAS